MKEILDQYCAQKSDDHVFVRRDFYNIYAEIEKAGGRTPLPYYYYCVAMERYWHEAWKFVIRLNHVLMLNYGLGDLLVVRERRQHNPGHRIKWRKRDDRKRKIKNQDLYGFREFPGDQNYGRRGLQTWVRETRRNPELQGYEIMME